MLESTVVYLTSYFFFQNINWLICTIYNTYVWVGNEFSYFDICDGLVK